MARTDGRIEPGQKLSTAISARAWNRAQDAADRVLGVGTGIEVSALFPPAVPYTWIRCVNATNQNLPRWSVVELDVSGVLQGISTLSASNGDDLVKLFESTPLLNANTPGFYGYDNSDVSFTPKKLMPFGICVEPVAAGGIVRVAVSGLVQTKISFPENFYPDTGYNRGLKVRPQVGNTSTLVADHDGTAEVIWSQQVSQQFRTQSRWALVRLGVTPAPKLLQGTSVLRVSPDGDCFWRKDESQLVTVYNPSLTVPERAMVFNRMANFTAIPEKKVNSITYVPRTLSPVGVTFAAIENEWRLVSIVSSTFVY